MSQRRENGTGSVCRRKDGRWQSRMVLGNNENGEPRRKYFYGDTEKEALWKMEMGIAEWQREEENKKYTRSVDNIERGKYKRRAYVTGNLVCAVCGWGGMGWPEIIEAHHVIPFSDGGRVCDENMILLCPNHHGIAHYLMRIRPCYGKEPFSNKDELFNAIICYERDYAEKDEPLKLLERVLG